jgi:hypothetical protein
MKKINVAYWVTTILIAGFILFTAVPNIMVNDDSVKLINTSMGFPKYMIPFLGVAKALGVIAILVPGFPRIKEWAYAGIFFDVAGATYSFIALGAGIADVWLMFLTIAVLLASYFLYHAKLKMAKGNITQQAKFAAA